MSRTLEKVKLAGSTGPRRLLERLHKESVWFMCEPLPCGETAIYTKAEGIFERLGISRSKIVTVTNY